jgi:ATP-dependent helicase YprA (DUF1998 family)
MSGAPYSVDSVVRGLKQALTQYLESQYHIWDESIIDERRILLETPGTIAQHPFIEATPTYVRGQAYADLPLPEEVRAVLTRCAAIAKTGVFPQPYLHQVTALVEFFSKGKQLVVASGTGSGKTETFLFPILGVLAQEAAARPRIAALPGCRALLLYPMNALVNDQLTRLRRLFGNREVAAHLAGPRGRNVRFGIYTSRTPYPGRRDPLRDRDELQRRINALQAGITPELQLRLEDNGLWPAKDMRAFQANQYQTGPQDIELFTRHEMQQACPDVLVTNYSMLEYMLLRPVDGAIFDSTSTWLNQSPENFLTVVVDEAHVYRGSSGAEVSLLLRRLRSRLGVARDKLRYILTSASLGTGAEAGDEARQFASDLTGGRRETFSLIAGTREVLDGAVPASGTIAQVLAGFDLATLHSAAEGMPQRERAAAGLAQLAASLSVAVNANSRTLSDVRDTAYRICEALPVARHLANKLSEGPTHLADLAGALFPNAATAGGAVDVLLALVSFARRSLDEKPFLPLRLHLLFRGVDGLYACINPSCGARLSAHGTPTLGKLYNTPRLHCDCGSRVYELLTHRDCGAAFIRGYWRENDEGFLWHEAPSDRNAQGGRLIEVHLLVEPARATRVPVVQIWIHKRTGRVQRARPTANSTDYLMVGRPGTRLPSVLPPIISFNPTCPICDKRVFSQGRSKIMDLQTKGEAPFSYLVREQVRLQPATRAADRTFPNAGRKALLFSDGRQKAARLARDIPRDIQKDTFRQLLVRSIHDLAQLGRDATPTPPFLYTAFLNCLARYGVRLFDGADADQLENSLATYQMLAGGDLQRAITNGFSEQPPNQYREQLLTHLGASFYSLYALTLAYLEPVPVVRTALESQLTFLSSEDVRAISIVWLQELLNEFAFDATVAVGVRQAAAGYSRPGWGATGGFSARQTRFVDSWTGGRAAEIEQVMLSTLCVSQGRMYFIDPARTAIRLGLALHWSQCQACTHIAPVSWNQCCASCGSTQVRPLDYATSPYLQARKRFWRDPAEAVLGADSPFTLDVQEHTAQLGYRDADDVASTTEEFERRFRDILTGPREHPIDVLSCTTTMEVGVDIGSLVAVGLRNVPPQRQNYQQRAGRAGRRGASISTVVTYAQNNAHDAYYFGSPAAVIAGPPPKPSIDASNEVLIRRHVNAQLLQTYFHNETIRVTPASSDIYAMWGDTYSFFFGAGDFTLGAFRTWLRTSPDAEGELRRVEDWIPPGAGVTAADAAVQLIARLQQIAPAQQPPPPDDKLLNFLFNNAVLPSYAFPRNLLTVRIEETINRRVRVEEQPQQGLNIALSEYAPGRFVVLNKKTYQIGSLTANRLTAERDRARPLFATQVAYVQCSNCYHTREPSPTTPFSGQCPVCANGTLSLIQIIQPEVAYPRGRRPIDELQDDAVRSEVTAAQLPFPSGGNRLVFQPIGAMGEIASGHNESLVIVNRGESGQGGGAGFRICERCGFVHLGGHQQPELIPHERDYEVVARGLVDRTRCNGPFRNAFIGYTFPTDILLLRIRLRPPFANRYDLPGERRPITEAVRSFSEALVGAACRHLDIDTRELKAGFRFLESQGDRCADVFLYDSLAGGAGYANLTAAGITEIVRLTQESLSECDCSSSCTRCLRNYENRLFHSSLNRFLALDLINYLRVGTIPTPLTQEQEDRVSAPLAEVLRLEGWALSRDNDGRISARRGGLAHSIRCVPSLADRASIPEPAHVRLVSVYEIENNLPDVFGGLAP